MDFIELTGKNGKKFYGNLSLLQRVDVNGDGGTIVIGWNNNGGIDVRETYEEVVEKINKAISKTKNQTR